MLIVRESEKSRIVMKAAQALLEEGIAQEDEEGGKTKNPAYTGGKWGGLYLRAPDIYFRILEKAKDKLVRLGDVAEVSSYIHDNNTGPRFPEAPFVKSLKNITSIRVLASSPGVQFYGVREDGQSSRLSLWFYRVKS
jgi:hypothetical protein